MKGNMELCYQISDEDLLDMEREEETLIPRDYQIVLEEIALKQNTIIHLPTGSGKTFIAIQLIKRFIKDLQQPWGDGGKRTFFLVNTVPLVSQQKKVLEKLCPVESIGGYCSEDKVDYWNKAKWDEEISKHQVIIMTAQILSDMLVHNYIKIENINLLIFDECHHAVDDHPMRMIMKQFESCPAHKHPRILGLTATLLNANVNLHKVEEALKKLETTFHATIATVNELGMVLGYSTNPQETILYYTTPALCSAGLEAVTVLQNLASVVFSVTLSSKCNTPEDTMVLTPSQKDITTDHRKVVKQVCNIITAMIDFIKDYGFYGGSLGILAYIIVLERQRRTARTQEETKLYQVVITHATIARLLLEHEMRFDTGYRKIVKYSSNQIIQLLEVLKEYNSDLWDKEGNILRINKERQNLCGIIFTRQRFSAKILYNLLKEVKKENPKEFGFIEHDFIVGFNISPHKNTREQYYEKKTSLKALLKFSNRDLNLLIATSVIEEGLDIPQCSLVLRFDPPQEYRSYVQSKGRARSQKSMFVIMARDQERLKFEKKYEEFQIVENLITNMLVGKSGDRKAPTKKELQNLYKDNVPSYYNPETGARLHPAQSISLLCRYCLTLPHDQFTLISPRWINEELPDGANLITIYLPLASKVKEPISGDPYHDLKSARRSAAIKACQALYEAGELDPVSMLPSVYSAVDFDIEDVKKCFPLWIDEIIDIDEDVPRPGTSKYIRKHEKVYPSCLNGSKKASGMYYLHIINLKSNFEIPTEPCKKTLYDFIENDHGFGFITASELPTLCEFPTYLSVGEVTTNIDVNYATVAISNELFDVILNHQHFIYDQVLRVAKKFVVFEGTKHCMFAVVVKKESCGFVIDWDTMKGHSSIPSVEEPSYESRKNLIVDSSYKHTIVTPWYRCIAPARYVVCNVLEYKTPQSSFDDNNYLSYEKYYQTRYNLELFGPKDQPMLEVEQINTRMNCLLPRAATITSLSAKELKLITAQFEEDKRLAFKEYLIPEFCVKYDFPAILWYKALMLPSIAHRVRMLLVAEELRRMIAIETGMGVIKLKSGHKWKPIVPDSNLILRSMLDQIKKKSPLPIEAKSNGEPDKRKKKLTMKQAVYQLQQKKLNNDYPWDPASEPIDIERNINTVTRLDVDCYDEWVSAEVVVTEPAIAALPIHYKSPSANTAIMAPVIYKENIELLSKDLRNPGPELRDILAALTTIKSSDAINLERVETLGDSFLKYAATLYLFLKFPHLNEGQLTNIKSKLIGNRNLYYAGQRFNLPGKMKTETFLPTQDFEMPGFFAPQPIIEYLQKEKIRPTFLFGLEFSKEEMLSGVLSAENLSKIEDRKNAGMGALESEAHYDAQAPMQCYVMSQAVPDKNVADCVEALIGTYVLSNGIPGGVKFLQWLQIIPPQDDVISYLNVNVPTVFSRGLVTVDDIDFTLNHSREQIERKLNYKFRDPAYLLEAMTHASYMRNRETRSYERFEFLGDAILDFLITSHLFETYKSLSPGDITDLRSALVNNVTFASYLVKLGLHKYICSQLNPVLDRAIMAFVEHQERRDHKIEEDVLLLIDEADCKMAEYVEVPKVLSDIFESLAAAIYLDSGGDLQTVWKVFYNVMWKEIDMFSSNIPKQPVRMLYESKHASPVFEKPIENKEAARVMVPVSFSKLDSRIIVYGFGSNKHEARRAAAKLALRVLEI